MGDAATSSPHHAYPTIGGIKKKKDQDGDVLMAIEEDQARMGQQEAGGETSAAALADAARPQCPPEPPRAKYFTEQDCGGEGDCFFCCASQSLREHQLIQS